MQKTYLLGAALLRGASSLLSKSNKHTTMENCRSPSSTEVYISPNSFVFYAYS